MTDSRNGDTPLTVGVSILQVILDELRRLAPLEITVFSRDAKDTRSRHRVEHVVECAGRLGVRRRRS